MTKSQLIIFGVVGVIIIIAALLFACVIPGTKKCQPKSGPSVISGKLQIWGVGDTPLAFGAAIVSFNQNYPDIEINYRNFDDWGRYDNALLEAMAIGRAPDIFMIPANALIKYTDKIYPLPGKLSLLDLRRLFPSIVESNLTGNGTIFALPASLDTLSLIYNKDLLNQAGIPLPPQTWDDFKKIVPQLTKFDASRHITQSAAAIGGTLKSIDNAADILSLLMLQTGAKMVNDDFSAATFSSDEGVNALNFYTQFVRTQNSVYTWDDALPNSLDAFAQEKTAMIFDYASAITKIKARNPFLNLGIGLMPQPKDAAKAIAYPNYGAFTVWTQSQLRDLAWNFILKLTTEENNAKAYFEATHKPPALLSLIGQLSQDPDWTIFARQALIAKSWPQIDPQNIKNIFSQAIESVATNREDAKAALDQAQLEITQLMARRSY